MENDTILYKALLAKLGYNHIGLIDEEKKIWGYSVDNHFFFCKEDLSEIKKDVFFKDNSLLFISIRGENLKILKDNDKVGNFIVIDLNGNIIYKKELSDNYVLKILSNYHFIITSDFDKIESVHPILYHPIFENDDDLYQSHKHDVYTFIDDKYYPDLDKIDRTACRIGKHDEKYIIERRFVILTETKKRQLIFDTEKKELIYDGEPVGLWFHDDGSLDLLRLCNTELQVVSSQDKSAIKIRTINANILNINDRCRMIDIPRKDDFLENLRGDSNVLICKEFIETDSYRVIVNNYVIINIDISHLDFFKIYNLDLKTSDYGLKALSRGIIIEDRNNRNDKEGYYYDFYGSYIGTYDREDGDYMIICNNSVDDSYNKPYGVMKLYNFDIIIPVEYSNIKFVSKSNELFEATLMPNYPDKYLAGSTGLYHRDELVVPFGMEIHYLKYDLSGIYHKMEVDFSTGEIINDSYRKYFDYIAYGDGFKYGLIHNGKKVSDLEYDEIIGYGIKGCFHNDKRSINYQEYPSCCLLRKDELWAIYINEDKKTDFSYREIEVLRVEGHFYQYESKIFYRVVDSEWDCTLLDDNLEYVLWGDVQALFPDHLIVNNLLCRREDKKRVFDLEKGKFYIIDEGFIDINEEYFDEEVDEDVDDDVPCCPECGSANVTDDGSDYLQYECNDCGHTWGNDDDDDGDVVDNRYDRLYGNYGNDFLSRLFGNNDDYEDFNDYRDANYEITQWLSDIFVFKKHETYAFIIHDEKCIIKEIPYSSKRLKDYKKYGDEVYNPDIDIMKVEGNLHYDIVRNELFYYDPEQEEPDYPDYDDHDYERDTYYALGGDDYDRWREGGGNLDDMMDGMGF